MTAWHLDGSVHHLVLVQWYRLDYVPSSELARAALSTRTFSWPTVRVLWPRISWHVGRRRGACAVQQIWLRLEGQVVGRAPVVDVGVTACGAGFDAGRAAGRCTRRGRPRRRPRTGPSGHSGGSAA